jgi:hypothetical protein
LTFFDVFANCAPTGGESFRQSNETVILRPNPHDKRGLDPHGAVNRRNGRAASHPGYFRDWHQKKIRRREKHRDRRSADPQNGF